MNITVAEKNVTQLSVFYSRKLEFLICRATQVLGGIEGYWDGIEALFLASPPSTVIRAQEVNNAD